MIQNFIDTVKKKEDILTILSKNGWKNKNQSFQELSFQKLRTTIIPELFNLYSKEKFELRTCFESTANCSLYIHTLVNNYDLHQLNTYPKRIYNYTPPIVYPRSNFKDINKEHIQTLVIDEKSLSIIG